MSEIEDWLEELMFFSDISACIIAISRKCPRLLEAVFKYFDVSNCEKYIENIISEHAIPFHFLSKTSCKLYVLSDDSVIYGSTFNKIENLITTFQKYLNLNEECELIKIPFSVNENAKVDVKAKLLLKEAEIPDFVDREMSMFSQSGPYDMEFPIITYEGIFDKETLEGNIKLLARRINPAFKSYSLAYKSIMQDNEGNEEYQYYSWTILGYPINERNKRSSDSEFSKIRFFLNRDCTELKIVPFSPYLLSSYEIDSFFDLLREDYKQLYTLPYGTVKSFLKQSPDKIEFEQNDFEYAQYQTEKSLVIWVNYLISLNYFLKLKKIFEDLPSFSSLNKNLSINKKDIRYLLGENISNQLYFLLHKALQGNQILNEFAFDYEYVYVNGFKDYMIPARYEMSFFNELRGLYANCDTVEEIVNVHFYAQHVHLDVKSREKSEDVKSQEKSVDVYKRLRFGTTYQDLYSHVQHMRPNQILKIGKNETIKELHKIMDSLIDKGAAVPKYAKLDNGCHKPVWTRLFRAGERKPPLLEILSLSLTILNVLFKKSGFVFLRKHYIDIYLLQTLGNYLNLESLINLSIFNFKIALRHDSFVPYYAVMKPDGEGFLLDWLIDNNYLKRVATDYYSLNEDKSQMKSLPVIACPFLNVVQYDIDNIADVLRYIVDNEYSSFVYEFSFLGFSQKQVDKAKNSFFESWLNLYIRLIDQNQECSGWSEELKKEFSENENRLNYYRFYYKRNSELIENLAPYLKSKHISPINTCYIKVKELIVDRGNVISHETDFRDFIVNTLYLLNELLSGYINKQDVDIIIDLSAVYNYPEFDRFDLLKKPHFINGETIKYDQLQRGYSLACLRRTAGELMSVLDMKSKQE